MNPELRELIAALLAEHEGFRSRRYQCPAGKWTIGYGHTGKHVPNNDQVSWSQKKANEVLLEDIQSAREIAGDFVGLDFLDLSPIRQTVLICMAFNLGRLGLFRFKRLRVAVKKQDWRQAAVEIVDSLYAGPPPQGVNFRAWKYAAMMRLDRMV